MTFQIPWEVNTKSTNFHPGGVISCICYRLVAPQRLRFFSGSPYDFDHYSLKSSRIFKTTTRAYKRTQNSIFSSRIASPFKKRNVTPPPTIPRTATPGLHSRPILISRLLRMRINEIKKEEDATEDVNSAEKRKVYWPAISYWLAIQSVDGLRVSTVPLHSALLKTGMEVTAKSLPDCKRGKEENASAPVCTTIKDHNNDFLQRKVDLSFEHCLETLQSQVLDEQIGPIQGSERVVRLQVVRPSFAVELQRKVIPALLKAGLQFDVFGIQAASEPERTPVGKALAASSVVVALNEIERAIKKLGCAVHHGDVFKKNPAAKFTFEHSCTVKKFLSILSNN